MDLRKYAPALLLLAVIPLTAGKGGCSSTAASSQKTTGLHQVTLPEGIVGSYYISRRHPRDGATYEWKRVGRLRNGKIIWVARAIPWRQ